MTDFKINGLIIQERELGDNDKLLTVLSERYGKLFVVGKGVKSLKNRHMHCCQLLSYVTLNLRRKGRYYYITESDLIENFFDIRNDLLKLSLATFVCEVIDSTVQEGVEENEILRLALNTLAAISSEKKPLETIRASFQLKILAESGIYPDLTACSSCGKEEILSGYLDLIDGIVVCDECKNNLNTINKNDAFLEHGINKPIALISKSIIFAINYIVNSDSKRFLSFTLDESELQLFYTLSEGFLVNQLERGFSTLNFYKSLL